EIDLVSGLEAHLLSLALSVTDPRRQQHSEADDQDHRGARQRQMHGMRTSSKNGTSCLLIVMQCVRVVKHRSGTRFGRCRGAVLGSWVTRPWNVVICLPPL